MAPLVFYHSAPSPFSRSVHLLIRYLKINADIKLMDLQEKKEQFSPEFLKINPQHCVSN
jgi:glutathione S-transferase